MSNLIIKTSKYIAVIVLFVAVSCNVEDTQKLDNRDWQLVWSDDFNGALAELPDVSKWTYDIGTGDNGWGNYELQYYTNRPENVSMDGKGNLVITAIKENFNGSSFTSARIKTKGLLEQKYGRFEARIKTPYGQGIWPAFWMLGNDSDTVVWPNCGEIDIMELRGQKPNTIESTIHGPGYSGANSISSTNTLVNDRFDADFHIFALEWDENKIDFFVDNYLFRRIKKSETEAKGQWVYDHPFYLILDVAVGGSFLGSPSASTPFPQKMTIDYVRVYK